MPSSRTRSLAIPLHAGAIDEEMRSVGKWLRPLGAVIVLALLLRHLGWLTVRDAVVAVGPWFAAIALADMLGLVCDAAAIASFVRPIRMPLGRALVAQASGYAVNQLTPGNALGEPIKVAILARDVPDGVAVSALVQYNVATFAVSVAGIAVGVPIALAVLELSAGATAIAWLAAAALVGVLAAVVVAVRRAPCALGIRALRRVRAIREETAAAWRQRTAPIDRELAEFGARGRRRGFAFVVAARGVHWIGTLVLLRAVGILDNTPLVVAILTLGIAIGWAASVMPLGLGISDGAHGTLYQAFGATGDAGLAFAMLDRARACLAAVMAVGLAAAVMAVMAPQRRDRVTGLSCDRVTLGA